MIDYLLLHWKSLLAWLWLVTGIYLALRIIWQQRAPVATLAWIMILGLVPPVGILIYHFFGPTRVNRQTLRRTRSRILLASENDMDKLLEGEFSPSVAERQHQRLIEAACGMPVSSCASIERLRNGDATFSAILQAVADARQHIHLEYYIFDPDSTGSTLLTALTAKAREGVHVRLLVDGLGSARLLGRRGRKLLHAFTEAGGELAVFHPARLHRMMPFVNLRTHRKILVVDGHIGFTGGINVTDDGCEKQNPETAYRDTHLRMEGAAVRWLQYTFMQDWVYASGRHQFEADVFPPQEPGDHAVQVLASGPDSGREAIHRGMLHAINMAKVRILLTTPYFVPTEPAFYALINAALRGVDVQIMVPMRSDSFLVTWAARSYFGTLRMVGVKIFEYQGKGMLHAKTLVVDTEYSMIGTANFDNRSFLLNFENAVVLYGPEMNAQLAADFADDRSRTRYVTQEIMDQRSQWHERMLTAFARLLSPLL